MKKHFLKFWITLLAACAVFMAANAITGHAQDAPSADGSSARPDYCAVSFVSEKTGKTIKSVYNDEDKGFGDVISEYHENVNELFNQNIKEMMKAEAAAAKSMKMEPRGQPPRDENGNFQPCPEDNYSTYCVAQKILTDESEGYIAYIRALECRRGKLFDTKTEEIGYSDVMETAMSAGISNPAVVEGVAGKAYQTQKALELSARMEAIDREKSSAKRALDQTLAAYNELRTAWPMHKKYMQIYESLLIYRDKMVEIRKQVEEFPSKFIDASTTKCT